MTTQPEGSLTPAQAIAANRAMQADMRKGSVSAECQSCDRRATDMCDTCRLARKMGKKDG